MKYATALMALTLLLVVGCDGGPASQLKGSWTGPMNSVLKVTDKQWIVSAGLLEVTLSYKIVSSDGDAVVVELKRETGDAANVTCRISGNTLRITQPVNKTLGLGGTWTRQ